MCVRTYHVRNNYVTYIVAMQPYFSQLWQFRLLLCVAVYHSYDFEMDTGKQRQCRRDDARLTESGNARSEQLNTRGAYRVANQQSLACLSGSECRRPGWFLDIKYQTSLIRLSCAKLWAFECKQLASIFQSHTALVH